MWNKVIEKQPTKEDDYLVYIEHHTVDGFYRTTEVARYFPDSNHFQFFGKAYKKENKFKQKDSLLQITHWQDLPQPPKEEKE